MEGRRYRRDIGSGSSEIVAVARTYVDLDANAIAAQLLKRYSALICDESVEDFS